MGGTIKQGYQDRLRVIEIYLLPYWNNNRLELSRLILNFELNITVRFLVPLLSSLKILTFTVFKAQTKREQPEHFFQACHLTADDQSASEDSQNILTNDNEGCQTLT